VWKARWQAAFAAKRPLARELYIRANGIPNGDFGDPVGNPPSYRYEENGNSMAYMLLLTGDADRYADACFSRLPLFETTNANWWREELIRSCYSYDALKSVGFWERNPDKKQRFFDIGNQRCAMALTYGTLLYGDSDQVYGALGVYAFGLCTKDEGNPHAEKWLTDPMNELIRQQVVSFAPKAKGGQHIESSDYNKGTNRIGALALEYIRAKTGHDYIPEYRDWFEEAAVSEMTTSPDFAAYTPWGDVEHGHDITGYEQKSHLYALLGVTGNPYLRRYIRDFETKVTDWFNKPWTADFAAFLPPDGEEKDYRELPFYADKFGVYDNAGIGRTMVQDDFAHGGTFGALDAVVESSVDHARRASFDLCLFFRGVLTFSHPSCYMGLPETYNTPLIYGAGRGIGDWTMGEFKGRLAYEATPDAAYFLAARGGSSVSEGYIGPPDLFVHESSRSAVYLPGGAAGMTLVVHARDHIKAPWPIPATLDGIRNQFNVPQYMVDQVNTLRRKEQLWHATGEPTVTGNVITWDAGNGVGCRITVFGDVEISVEKETADNYWEAPVSELGWCIRVTYAGADRDWDTATYVLQHYNATAPLPEPVAIRSANGEAEGVIVRRPGYANTALLFNARVGPDLPPSIVQTYKLYHDPETPNRLHRNRLHPSGFTVELPDPCDVLLYDLPSNPGGAVEIPAQSRSVTVTV
jgi:hypothetical protein